MRLFFSIIAIVWLAACQKRLLPKAKVIKEPSPQLYYRYAHPSKDFAFDFPWYGRRFFKKLDDKAAILLDMQGIKKQNVLFYTATYLSHHLRFVVVDYGREVDHQKRIAADIKRLQKNKSISQLQYEATPSVKIDSNELYSINDYKVSLKEGTAFAQLRYRAILQRDSFICADYYVVLKDKSLLRLITFLNQNPNLYDETDRAMDSFWFYRNAQFNLAFLKQPTPALDSTLNVIEPFTLAKKVFETRGSHPYLSPINALIRDSMNYDTLRREFKNIYYQALMTYYSMAGYAEEAMAMRDTAMGYSRPDSCTKATFEGYKAEDAVDVICRQLRDKRLVMLNEAHHSPIHRLFVMRLLDSLKAHGFHYLALEALAEKNRVAQNGYPTTDDGFYVREPMYAEMVRYALSKGFRLIAYDHAPECLPPPDAHRFYCHNMREAYAAKTIINQSFKKDKKAKVFVLVGHDHNYKNHYLAQRIRVTPHKWTFLAMMLRNITGFDPLSINQSDMVERSLREYESPFYRCAWLTFSPDKSVILHKNGQSWIKPEFESMIDAYIFHQRTSRDTPYEWLGQFGYVAHSFDFSSIPSASFIQVFYENELKKASDKAIPALNYPLHNDLKPMIWLKPRINYHIKIFSKKGDLIKLITYTG